MSVLDKPKFTANDFVKGFVLVASLGTAWLNLNLKLSEIDSKISELKIYKTADDKVVNERLDKLEVLAENNHNRTTEVEKKLIIITAVLPRQIRIENEN